MNNAGYSSVFAAEDESLQHLHDIVKTHFFGPVMLTKGFLPHFRARGSGTIVFNTTVGTEHVLPGVSGYNASKSALNGRSLRYPFIYLLNHSECAIAFSDVLLQEVQPFGIRVMAIQAGNFRTPTLHNPALLPPVEVRRASPYDPIYQQLEGMAVMIGREPGDPKKGARRIIEVITTDKLVSLPARLALGVGCDHYCSRSKCSFSLYACRTRHTPT